MGPRSPGSGYVLLHHYLGEVDGVFRAWGFARGGTGALSQAIASAAREAGVEIQVNAPVAQVIVKNGAAAGVALENGDEYYADIVVSNADAKRTFLKLVEQQHLPDEFLHDVKRLRSSSPACKVNLALDGLPEFTSLPKGKEALLRGSIEIAPSVEYLERAYDDAKYGGWARKPFMDALIPSLLDPGMAPPGKHVMSLFVQYASSDLEGGWNEQKKAAVPGCGGRHAGRVRAEPEGHHSAQAHHDALGYREHHRHHIRPYLPRRAGAPAAVLPAPIAAVVELPHSDSQPVYVRQQHAPRRLHHRRARPQRRSGHSGGSPVSENAMTRDERDEIDDEMR